MNKKIWFVRHGESTANAGGITSNHETIPLSLLGQEQAKRISREFRESPTLIITSPFLRAIDTAEPTLKRFPNTRREVWNVEEFTYLSPSNCVNTTAADRKGRVNEYWERCNPDYRDGEGAESFNDLLTRAKTAIERVGRLEEGFIVMFTHAQFMRAIWALLDFTHEGEDAKSLMMRFRQLPRYKNCAILKWDENNYFFDETETYLEKNLPRYLQHDLDALIEGKKNNSSLLDCFWSELYGSVNSAEADREITGKQANFLRNKYL